MNGILFRFAQTQRRLIPHAHSSLRTMTTSTSASSPKRKRIPSVSVSELEKDQESTNNDIVDVNPLQRESSSAVVTESGSPTPTSTDQNLTDSTNTTSSASTTSGASSDTNINTMSEGQGQEEWVTIDPATCKGVYGLGISVVAPRPVAVITSKNKNGDLNCAPFSYTGLLSHDPPMVAHGLCLSRTGRKKDTLINIEETGQWVYNVLTDHWIHQANACSEEVDRDVNELEITGLNTLPCDIVQLPRVKEAMVSMECQLESKKEIINDGGKHTTTVVFGRIVKYHVHKSVLAGTEEKPVVDLEKIRFCGRAGDVTYWPAGSGKALPLKRP